VYDKANLLVSHKVFEMSNVTAYGTCVVHLILDIKFVKWILSKQAVQILKASLWKPVLCIWMWCKLLLKDMCQWC